MTVPDTLLPTEPFEVLRRKPQQFYLFGEHISRSKAPFLLNTVFKLLNLDWKYSLKETSSKHTFNNTFAQEACIGSAITMPNKVTFVREMDMVDAVGTSVGAINTVYSRKNSDGTVVRIGTNTDTVGIHQSFLQTPAALTYVEQNHGRPGLVYGGGGASRSAVYVLHRNFQCHCVYVVNRDQAEVEALQHHFNTTVPELQVVHVKTPEEAMRVEPPVLCVLSVPNITPITIDEKLAKATLTSFMHCSRGAVVEMCYHPVIETDLYLEFQEAGWEVVGGHVAMMYQGFAQVQLWGGYQLSELPVKEARDILERHINST
ncbi:quinate/shikimate dehydrogenase [Yamadazyma tenuis]|uniref:NAD(P)-binding protein n=1 Tax=Candida tenuis (strain ATCC 10573 / BCRC 21748 / CBS 615 / JCM 9827 / NBRC 10315 / NRRL Y-1498 / VKM Y-70) TaxID=590646 RepID=G3AX82_CANTC|nr:NAD(P)-binding protein [Yamadazyma tenuis ATCC 10573]EGV66715.1 NAD(P)-binding protein [Yamadazyma tenuis ATCC 10573]WEJ95152.1 quinate/shikimate dehydrogenase [Yamadazyma tenuis]